MVAVAMANHGILIFLALLNLYLLIIYVLHKKDLLEPYGLSLFGPALMMRTQKGKRLIDRIAGPKEWWKRYGDATIWTVVIAGVAMMGLLVVGVFASFSVPAGREVTAQEVLAIPGLNPFIPLGYGIMALAIGIVIHEFAHGIVARAHDLKVKSLGLLLFIVPIGAFMEPDEEELMGSHPRIKTRVFAAGAGTSILVSFIFAGVYSFGFIPMAEPAAPGMGVVNTWPGSPAEEVGVAPGMIITSIDGRSVETAEQFQAAFNGSAPGDRMQFTVYSSGNTYTGQATLVDRHEFFVERCMEDGTSREECDAQVSDEFRGEGFFGVRTFPPDLYLQLHQPSLDPGVTFHYLFLPIDQGFSPVRSPFANFYVIEGPLGALGLGGFWMLANSFYWLFWINFLLGTFNALPLTVLDGGHVFREGMKKVLRSKDPPPDPEVVETRTDQATRVMTILVVGAILAQLIIPYLVNSVL